MIQFNSVAVLALVAVMMCWSLAVVLYRVGVAGSVARRLSLLLLVEGITLISTGYIDSMLAPKIVESDFYASWVLYESVVHTLGDGLMLVLYPPFLAAALRVDVTRPFESRTAMAGLITVATASSAKICRARRERRNAEYREHTGICCVPQDAGFRIVALGSFGWWNFGKRTGATQYATRYARYIVR